LRASSHSFISLSLSLLLSEEFFPETSLKKSHEVTMEEEEEEEPRRVRSPPPPNSSVDGDVLLDQQLQRDEVRFPFFVCAGDDIKHIIARCIFLYTDPLF